MLISACGNEWVFFNAGQVLPCYVIEVKIRQCSGLKKSAPSLAADTFKANEEQLEGEKESERRARLQARVDTCLSMCLQKTVTNFSFLAIPSPHRHTSSCPMDLVREKW